MPIEAPLLHLNDSVENSQSCLKGSSLIVEEAISGLAVILARDIQFRKGAENRSPVSTLVSSLPPQSR